MEYRLEGIRSYLIRVQHDTEEMSIECRIVSLYIETETEIIEANPNTDKRYIVDQFECDMDYDGLIYIDNLDMWMSQGCASATPTGIEIAGNGWFIEIPRKDILDLLYHGISYETQEIKLSI